jgi:hypothetical protein
MTKKKYTGTIEIDFEVDIDDSVIDMTQEEEWQRVFYNRDRNWIADKIIKIAVGYNSGNVNWNDVDGFYHLDAGLVNVKENHWYIDGVLASDVEDKDKDKDKKVE